MRLLIDTCVLFDFVVIVATIVSIFVYVNDNKMNKNGEDYYELFDRYL